MLLTIPRCVYPAWELYYGIIIPSTSFERVAFLGWFLADLQFTAVAIYVGHKGNRIAATNKVLLSNIVIFALFWPLSKIFPNHHATAYFTAFRDQSLVTWGCIHDLVRNKSTKGHSLEIW